MLPIQVGSLLEADEEGGAVRIGAGIGHRENSRSRMAAEGKRDSRREEGGRESRQLKVFIRKFSTVDGLPATGGTLETLEEVKSGEGDGRYGGLPLLRKAKMMRKSRGVTESRRTLAHEPWNDSVEHRLLVMQRPPALTESLFSC